MDHPPERIELISVPDKRMGRTYTFIVPRPGFFTKLVAVIVACALLPLAFVFSLLILSIVLAVVLVILAYVWWAHMRLHRSMRVADGKKGRSAEQKSG
jgi:hypothetical protein